MRWVPCQADYSLQCASEGDGREHLEKKYAKYVPFVASVALVWSLGIPFAFLLLVQRFKVRGQTGDQVVHHALGPS